MFDATRKFLSAQFEIQVNLYVQLVTLVLHLIICYLFVVVFDWRDVGAALATDITYILNMVGIDLYCYFNPRI